MQEVKSPKRPMMYYYLIAVLIMILLNSVVGSVTQNAAVETVDYSTFMSSIENKTIDKVDIELGEWAQVGTPIATLLSLDPIVIRAGVSEADVALVSKGSPASVRLLDGAEVQGTVRHVAKQASDKTRTFEIEVALPNSDGAIPAGMTAEVRLSGPPQRAITVPRSVLTLNDEGQIGLRVVGADNVARFVAVSIIEDGEKGLVIAGVPDGVRVVVAGQDLIRDGDKVNVSEIDITKAAEGLE